MGQGLGKTGWTIVKFLNFVLKRTSENAVIASRGKLVFWKDRLHVPNSDQKCSRSAILLMSTFATHGWEFITDNEHSESNIFIHIWHRWAPHGPYVVRLLYLFWFWNKVQAYKGHYWFMLKIPRAWLWTYTCGKPIGIRWNFCKMCQEGRSLEVEQLWL